MGTWSAPGPRCRPRPAPRPRRRARTRRTPGRRPRCCRARRWRRDRARPSPAPSGRETPSSPSPAPRARPGASPDRSPRPATRAASRRRSGARCPSAPARCARTPCRDRRRCRGIRTSSPLFRSAMSTSVIAARPLGVSSVCSAALERRDALLERERRRRSVQAVGVAGLVAPVARAQGGDVREQHRRRLVHRRLHRAEAGRRLVAVADQRRAARRRFLHPRARPSVRPASRPGRGRRRRRCARA